MKLGWSNVFIYVVPIVASLYFLVSGVSHWQSEEQQLKRACWDATQESLVSPATASLAKFSIHRAGTDLDVIRELDTVTSR